MSAELTQEKKKDDIYSTLTGPLARNAETPSYTTAKPRGIHTILTSTRQYTFFYLFCPFSLTPIADNPLTTTVSPFFPKSYQATQPSDLEARDDKIYMA